MKRLPTVALCSFLLVGGGLTTAPAMGAAYHTVTISSEVPLWVMNLTTVIMFVPQEGSNDTVLLAREGDLLMAQGEDEEEVYGLAFRYRPADGLRLRVRWQTQATYKVFLNDRLVSLEIWDDPVIWQWIRDADAREFRCLRSISYSAERGDISALERIARTNPHVGLAVTASEGDESNAERVVSLFEPSWLVLPDGERLSRGLLPNLKHLELLYASSSGNTAILSALPRLKTLIWWESGDDETAFEDLTPDLESLTLLGAPFESLSDLGRFKQLRTLHLISCPIAEIGVLPSWRRLRSAGFARCEELEDASALAMVSGLEWVTFPPDISQEQFTACVDANRRLQVVGIQGCDDLQDLSVLERLPKLKALLLDPPEEGSPALPALPRLETAFVSETDVSDAQRAQLSVSFPNAQVAAAGYCLGSGWILLVVPLAAAATLMARRRCRSPSA